jgi:hypothetical protein
MGFVGAISENPFHNHAGIEDDRPHGLPRLLAERITLSVTLLARFRNANNFSMALARR